MQKRKAINVLFICPYPTGMAPSQRFRFEQYFELMRNAGIEFHVKPFYSPDVWSILYKNGAVLKKTWGIVRGFLSRVGTLFFLYKYDYIFIHREATPIGPPVFEFLYAKVAKKKIIYDFDDAIWLPNTSSENSLAAKLKWHSKVKWICKWSHKISCGNSYLCDYARQFSPHVYINPTTIDTDHVHNRIHKLSHNTEVVTIGWTGSHSTLKYLRAMEEVFAGFEKEYRGRLRLLIIADKKPNLNISSMVFKPWSKASEVDDLLEFDIGIMPLTDDAWAKGKCGFKALQYMALSIPVVASPVGVNTTIIDHGMDGFLCNTAAEWADAIEKLIVDKALRVRMGERGRKKVVKNYSVASNSSNFLSLLQ